jgi:AcrR family transcriptional regulator
VISPLQTRPRVTPDTRSAILNKAAKLFSEKGYAGTSMSDLAEELGLSKAAIYHHFQGKASLLQNLMDSTFKDLENLIAQTESLPVNEVDLHKVLGKFAEITFAHREIIRLVLSQLPAEMKAQGPERHRCMIRLQKLFAGKNPTQESKMRARAGIAVIATGIVPPPGKTSRTVEKVDLKLLVNIASDALGLNNNQKK